MYPQNRQENPLLDDTTTKAPVPPVDLVTLQLDESAVKTTKDHVREGDDLTHSMVHSRSESNASLEVSIQFRVILYIGKQT